MFSEPSCLSDQIRPSIFGAPKAYNNILSIGEFLKHPHSIIPRTAEQLLPIFMVVFLEFAVIGRVGLRKIAKHMILCRPARKEASALLMDSKPDSYALRRVVYLSYEQNLMTTLSLSLV